MKRASHGCVGIAALLATGLVTRGAESAGPSLPVPPPAGILQLLKKEHPRLLASSNDFFQLRRRVTGDPTLKEWHRKLQAQADKILTEPPSQYEIPDGLRLLSVSRRVLGRVYTLALLYRLDGDQRYVARAWRELEAAAAFKDWNPVHFLDTAEMTHAFAIGYDWLFDMWTEAQRTTLRTAMIEKGLKPAIGVYRGTAKSGSWPKAHHNWNQVCNGGIGMGALALGDVEPELTGEILHAALRSIQIPMGHFAPDGAWNEGPGYWNYATSYNVVLLAALESALGTDFGLARISGFAETGLFPIYITGPTRKTFNYADSGDGPIRAPQMFWLAHTFHRPEYSRYERDFASPHAQDLLWFTAGDEAKHNALPLDKYFRGAEVAVFRSAWNDGNAVFAGLKAGDNKANHSHLDLGSFVLDALGVRWATDLGADDYNLPGYFGAQRWNYYRLRAESHNTLVINPGAAADQNPKAEAPILRFDSKPARAFAVTDLTAAYAPAVKKVWRGLALLNRQQVLVQDEFESAAPVEAFWFMHTSADVQVSDDGATATLKQGSARLHAQLLAPADVRFIIMEAAPFPTSPHPEKQRENRGVRKLAVKLTGVTDGRLAVLLTPLPAGATVPTRKTKLIALRDW